VNYENGIALGGPIVDDKVGFRITSLNIGYSFEDVKLTSVTSYFHRTGDTFYDGTNVAAYVFSGDSFPTLSGVAYYENPLNQERVK
jgi:hypothetical protein